MRWPGLLLLLLVAGAAAWFILGDDERNARVADDDALSRPEPGGRGSGSPTLREEGRGPERIGIAPRPVRLDPAGANPEWMDVLLPLVVRTGQTRGEALVDAFGRELYVRFISDADRRRVAELALEGYPDEGMPMRAALIHLKEHGIDSYVAFPVLYIGRGRP